MEFSTEQHAGCSEFVINKFIPYRTIRTIPSYFKFSLIIWDLWEYHFTLMYFLLQNLALSWIIWKYSLIFLLQDSEGGSNNKIRIKSEEKYRYDHKDLSVNIEQGVDPCFKMKPSPNQGMVLPAAHWLQPVKCCGVIQDPCALSLSQNMNFCRSSHIYAAFASLGT